MTDPDPSVDPWRYTVRYAVPEAALRLIEDYSNAFTTRNGRYVAVSRPSLSDVVWIDLRKAAAAGFTTYLTKPLDIPRLLALLDQYAHQEPA